jgi:hypothetical protein
VVRWRLIDLAQWVFDAFAIAISKQTLSRELRAPGRLGTVRNFVRRLGMIGAKEPADAATQRTSYS